MKKNVFAITLASALLLGCLSGCGGTDNSPAQETPQPTETAAAVATEAPGGENLLPSAEGMNGTAETEDGESVLTGSTDAPDFDLAFSRYAPDTPVMTVNGVTFDWNMYFDALRQNVNMIYVNYGINDLTIDMGDGQNIGDLMRESAESRLRQFGLIYSMAEERGIRLDAEDEAEIDEDLNSRLSYYNNDKDLLLASLGVSEEYYRYEAGESILYDKMLADQFGEHGSLLPDEDTLAYVRDNDILYAEHILFMTVDPVSRQKLDEEGLAKAKQSAEDTLAELRSASASELPELFARLMRERSEDTGLYSKPEGYFFQEGEMVDSFYQAAKSLAEGEMSDIVESEYGYHILYHPVLTPEVIYGKDTNGDPYTLREYVAIMLFNNMLNDAFAGLDISYHGDFENLNVAELFAK
ncbi:MAG: peptidylprolyl isomerase [Oscillospiraceae bacterium]|nr:peptidylprolyl isomerase [Oscillospiraceae bacterium]